MQTTQPNGRAAEPAVSIPQQEGTDSVLKASNPPPSAQVEPEVTPHLPPDEQDQASQAPSPLRGFIDPRRMQTPAAHLRETNPYIDLVERLPEFLLDMPGGLEQRGKWQARFVRPQPLYVELGAGYGHFLAQLAPLHLDRNYVGIELKFKRLFKAASKIKAQGLSNVQYLRFDVLALEQAFAPGELSGVYINFPDPWPKSTHVSKRMVSPLLVAQLERLLPVGATVELKSDWEPNREWFQEAFAGSRFEQTDYIANLSDWDRAHENVQTTYEARFRRSGLPCFFFEYTLR